MKNSEIIDRINATYDINKYHESKIKLNYDFNVNNKITAIIGGSGTGKTTLLRKFLNVTDVTFKIDSDECITKLLFDRIKSKEMNDVFKLLFDVGLSSVPVWKNSYDTLSNGEKLRFEIAYKILSDDEIIFVDEFTSMLDRQTAKNLCYKLESILDKYDKKLVYATCHYDVLDWLNTEELFDTNLKKSLVLSQLSHEKDTNWRYTLQKNLIGEYLSTIII